MRWWLEIQRVVRAVADKGHSILPISVFPVLMILISVFPICAVPMWTSFLCMRIAVYTWQHSTTCHGPRAAASNTCPDRMVDASVGSLVIFCVSFSEEWIVSSEESNSGVGSNSTTITAEQEKLSWNKGESKFVQSSFAEQSWNICSVRVLFSCLQQSLTTSG